MRCAREESREAERVRRLVVVSRLTDAAAELCKVAADVADILLSHPTAQEQFGASGKKGKPGEQFEGKCHACGEKGHKAAVCPQRKVWKAEESSDAETEQWQRL